MSSPGEPVLLATYDYRHEAEMARGILEDAGIFAAILADDVGGARPVFLGRVRLVVAEEDGAQARETLVESGLAPTIDAPAWATHSSPARQGPSLARDLAAMALLFGGVALLVLELFFDVAEDSSTLALVGAVALAIGAILTLRSIAESREARRRTG